MPEIDVIAAVEREAREDLGRLIPAARKAIQEHGPVRAAVELTSGLLEQPSWTRMMVASVLGVALAELAQRPEAGAPHGWQEFNEHGNTCHFPGCTAGEDEHHEVAHG